MSTTLVLSIILVCGGLITVLVGVLILRRLALRAARAYNHRREAFFEDLIFHAILDPQHAERLREIARRVYARRWGGAPGLRPFDVRALERSLLRVARELRGSERQMLTDIFEETGGLARGLRQLRSPGCCRRLAAVQKLRIMRSRQAVPELIAALNDRSRIVRHAALRALGEIGDERAYPFLLQALETPARWSPLRAADSVLAAGAAIAPLLIERFAAVREPQIRAVYVRLFGLLRDPAAMPLLLPLLDAPELPLCIAAIQALSAIGDAEAASRVRMMLSDPRWEIRAAAATALGALMDLESAPMLERLLDDPVYLVGYSAAQSLITLRGKGRAMLQEAPEASETCIVPLALQALGELAYGLV
ncbi:MAG: HEAT repeat domain-containing protein [Oscillochloridaceae bacterium]|nr:HEAT repeat domain-containing protein [Chloroflexaceae bacterium]MDW8390333.1 HEAT repeat domain-containing protein [Oscillochloridaceae bacterium]